MGATTWTPERVEIMGKLWKEGLSASKIGDRLGVSRNAVLSKLHRTGLSAGRARADSARNLRNGHARRRAKQRPKEGRAESKKTATLRALFPPGEERYRELPEELPAIPVEQRKGLADLDVGECRWPIGDPREAGFHFCARKQASGLPYCEHHARLAYRIPDNPPRRAHGRRIVSGRGEGSQKSETPVREQRRETEDVS